MKRTVCMIALIHMVTLSAIAQNNYIAPFFSYGFGLGTSDIRIENQEERWSYDTTIYSYTLENDGFSMGGGIKAGLLYGHQFNSYVGLELVVEYFRPAKKTTTEKYYEEFIPMATYNFSIEDKRTYSLHAINVVPLVKMSAGRNSWNPYVKCGILLSTQLMQEVFSEEIVNRYPGYMPFESTVLTYKYKPRFSVGATGALGMEWMNDRILNIYTEVQFQYLSFTPASADIVKASKEGKDILGTIPDDERHIEFLETIEELNVYDPDQTKRLKFSIPMTSVSICAGVRINLSSE
jgi:hypothetical protein